MKFLLKFPVPKRTAKGTAINPRVTMASGALAALAISMLLSSVGTSIVNVGLPVLAAEFSASMQAVQWVLLAYLLVVTTLVVAVGRLGDMRGRRRLLLAGIALFTFASVLCAAAPSLWLLIAARALQGLGAAVMMSLTMASVGDILPAEKTGSAMGLLGTMSAVGTALGPTVGGLLIARFGWPAIFLVNLPLGVVTLYLTYRFLPADRRSAAAERQGFDLAGTLLLALSLVAYALSMTVGRGRIDPLNIALILLAVLGFALFVLVQKCASTPLIQLAMFRDARLTAGFAMSSLVTTVVMATLVVGPFYLAGTLALDALHVGLAMSIGPVVASLLGAPAGRMVDRVGTQRMLGGGLVVMLSGCAMLSLAVGSGVVGYVAPLAVITAGYAVFQAANNTSVMMRIQAHQRGVVAGLLNLSRNLGLVTGAAVMGAVFVAGSGTSDIATAPPEAVAAGVRIVFAVAALLIAAALAIDASSCGASRRIERSKLAPVDGCGQASDCRSDPPDR